MNYQDARKLIAGAKQVEVFVKISQHNGVYIPISKKNAYISIKEVEFEDIDINKWSIDTDRDEYIVVIG